MIGERPDTEVDEDQAVWLPDVRAPERLRQLSASLCGSPVAFGDHARHPMLVAS